VNIVFVCNSRLWGGAEKYVIDLAIGLRERGHSCRLAVPPESPLQNVVAGLPQLESVPLDLGPKLGRRTLFEYVLRRSRHRRQLRRVLQECMRVAPVDLVHFQFKKEQLLGTRVARSLGLRVVWTEHNRLPRAFTMPRLPVVLYRRGANRTDGVVCVARFVARDLERRGVAPSRLHVIPNGIHVSAAILASQRTTAREGLGLGADVPVIGMVSRLERFKGHRFLLDALPLLRRRFPDLHVVIAGDGPARVELIGHALRAGIDHCITFTGHRRDISALLPAFDVFVSTSLAEGLPFSLLEAMAAGLPVVATSVGGVPELVRHAETGLLVPAGDAPALAHAIAALLTDPERCRRMGEAGALRVNTQFTMAGMIERTESVLLAAAGLSSPAPPAPVALVAETT
jgi:glycosyltransferase involved in cell wall biosynthesis